MEFHDFMKLYVGYKAHIFWPNIRNFRIFAASSILAKRFI